MLPPAKTNRSRESDEMSDIPSSNLWVGNLSADITESYLAERFSKFGELEKVTAYATRSYAFLFFKRIEDAAAAKKSLQGSTFGGNQIKIEFARPAKPNKSLWVSGISSNASKEELEKEFARFGKLEEFKFHRDRNTAYVDYFRLEDAITASKSLNDKRIGGEPIRVDFFRSQSRREQFPNFHDTRDGYLSGRGVGPLDSQFSAKRPYPQSSGGRRGDDQPSNVLWVGYPPSVHIDEQMLHNAMILFGEIENIKSFPSRNYSFIEFRSVEEARRAKEGLQGRLFNDPRITIMYSSSEVGPAKDHTGVYSGIIGSRPDMLMNDHPVRGLGLLPSILGPMRPIGLQGGFEHFQRGTEYNEFGGNSKLNMGPNWRRQSPSASDIVPSPGRLSMRQGPGSRDAYDPNQMEREIKRSRRDGSMTIDETFPLAKANDRDAWLDQSYAPGRGRLSPATLEVSRGASAPNYQENGYTWRGLIAKGGTPVCRARCVPVGKGIETELPEVVNCSARTGLDMLTKHYAGAIGFDIVFFLPDSEDDFESYTEFLRYLGSKNRAGVAKFDDGTTLFLVPPSDFLTNVLKISGRERLYGVVLKLPAAIPNSVSLRQESQPLPPSYFDQQRSSLVESDRRACYTRGEQSSPMNYNRVSGDEPKPPSRPLFAPTSEPVVVHSGPREQSHALTMSQAGMALTPELVATLTSLLPSASQSFVPDNRQPAPASSTPQILQNLVPTKAETPLQIWNQNQPASEGRSQSFQQLGNQYNPRDQCPSSQYHPAMSARPNFSSQMVFSSSQFPEPTVSLPQQATLSSRPLSSPGSHFAVSQPVSQQYQPEVLPSSQRGYGLMHGNDANNQGFVSNQAHSANSSRPQNPTISTNEQVHPGLPSHQVQQQLNSVFSGPGQGTSDLEADKTQRYQSALQLAANLLLGVQQQQQRQSNNPAGLGTGNRQ